jgi:pSer/pThr/pTyr-binding forkhead associated (FHA) protein
MKKTIPEGSYSDNKSQEKISKHTRVEGSKKSPIISSNRTVAGFLISFSADPTGEFWVLYEGRNRIGSERSNDVFVNDSKVSADHAIINIRHSVNDGRLLVAISDQNSSNGTIVNGRDIEFTPCELSNGDIIKIGYHEFGLLILDRVNKGLEPVADLEKSKKTSTQYTSPYDVSVKSSSTRKTKPE